MDANVMQGYLLELLIISFFLLFGVWQTIQIYFLRYHPKKSFARYLQRKTRQIYQYAAVQWKTWR